MVKAVLYLLTVPFISMGGICEKVKPSDHVPMPPHTVESKREIFGLCELILNIGGELVPVYLGENFLIAGEMFSRRMQVTQEQLKKVRSVVVKRNLQRIESLRYVSYKPEGAKNYFYFVSDPECPYCEKVKGAVKELADKYGWEVRVIWYPLPFHKTAKPKAVSHYCENRTYEDYLRNEWGKEQCEEGKKSVEENLRVLSSFVRGTPTFIFPDGKVIVGADMKKLEKTLRGGV